jgi:predicted HicB family RNase H-like nuclease
MAKRSFDPNAAFKNIVGTTSSSEPFIEKVNETGLKDSNEKSLLVCIKEKEEARSKRVNLLVKPSMYKMATDKCKSMGMSLNECINQLLENWSHQ